MVGKNEPLLTRKDLVKLFKISLRTVTNWEKKEILKPYKLGNKVYYRFSDIDTILKGRQSREFISDDVSLFFRNPIHTADYRDAIIYNHNNNDVLDLYSMVDSGFVDFNPREIYEQLRKK